MGNNVSRCWRGKRCMCCITNVSEPSENFTGPCQFEGKVQENGANKLTTKKEPPLDKDEHYGFVAIDSKKQVEPRFPHLDHEDQIENPTVHASERSYKNSSGNMCHPNRESYQQKSENRCQNLQLSCYNERPDTVIQNIQQVKHVHHMNYLINPQADAIVIGQDSDVKVNKRDRGTSSKKNRDIMSEKVDSLSYEVILIRKQNDEIIQRLQSMGQNRPKRQKNGRSNDVINNENIILGKGSIQRPQRELSARKDNDPYMFVRSNSNRKSRRKNTFKNDNKTHGLLQDLKWNLHETAQNLVLGKATCEVQKCESKEEVVHKVQDLRSDVKNYVDRKTTELEKCLGKSAIAKRRSYTDSDQKWKERTVTCLYDHKTKVIKQADEQLDKLLTSRKKEMQSSPVSARRKVFLTQGTNKESARTIVESFINLITDKITEYVSKLLPIDIQQEIIVFTFECQKSFVLKKMMCDFATGDFSECVRYILDPNQYARTWLTNFTNKKIFHYKKSGMNFYAKLANKKIEKIFKTVGTCIKHVHSEEKDNLPKWMDSFLKHIQASNQLPLSSADLTPMYHHKYQDACIQTFMSFLNSRLDNMKNGIVQTFKNTNEKTVDWVDNPYTKIVDTLWGCSECCPFCREPCLYADKDHIKQGFNHRCMQHRPLGVYGFRDTHSQKLITENCNYLIQSSDKGYKFKIEERLRLFGEYQKEFSDWKITSLPNDKPNYWNWFMCTLKDQLTEVYDAKLPDIPGEWTNYTITDAIRSLESDYICS
ncbi:uncharacterized protein [Mytilus edulis]|uniref:uncharacterized protein n=1 Tax=Mytilus edulis TaxID=6550 RepID=UPI0039EE4BE2